MGSCARKASLPPVSRASPLLPEQAGPVGRWAGEPGSSWLHPSHLELLSSMFLVCASSCPSSAHLGQGPKQVAEDRAPGGMCLPTGDLFEWGNISGGRQLGDAGQRCLRLSTGSRLRKSDGFGTDAKQLHPVTSAVANTSVSDPKVLLPGMKSA